MFPKKRPTGAFFCVLVDNFLYEQKTREISLLSGKSSPFCRTPETMFKVQKNMESMGEKKKKKKIKGE